MNSAMWKKSVGQSKMELVNFNAKLNNLIFLSDQMIASPDLWKKSILHSTLMPLNVISVGLVTNFSTFH